MNTELVELIEHALSASVYDATLRELTADLLAEYKMLCEENRKLADALADIGWQLVELVGEAN